MESLQEIHRQKRHKFREIQYQLERMASMLDGEEPLKPERRRILVAALREMAGRIEEEYLEHTAAEEITSP